MIDPHGGKIIKSVQFKSATKDPLDFGKLVPTDKRSFLSLKVKEEANQLVLHLMSAFPCQILQ